MFRSLCRNSLMVFIGAFDSRRVCFSAEHGPLCEKPLALRMWPWFFTVHLQQVKAAAAGEQGILFTPTLFPYSSLHTDATGLCKVSFHTPQSGEDGNRDIRHERALSLFAALVRRLLSRRSVVSWPFRLK